MPATMTLTENGTLTLDAELISYLGAKAGDRISVEKLPDKSLRVEAPKRKLDIMDLAGSLKTDIHLTLEEIEKGIIAGCLAENGELPQWKQ